MPSIKVRFSTCSNMDVIVSVGTSFVMSSRVSETCVSFCSIDILSIFSTAWVSFFPWQSPLSRRETPLEEDAVDN